MYEHLIFDGVEHVPLATLPGMRDRTITISSAGKTFSFTGWKIGWVCASPDLLAAVRTAKQFLTYVNGAPFQYAIAVGLALPDDVLHRLRRRPRRAGATCSSTGSRPRVHGLPAARARTS